MALLFTLSSGENLTELNMILCLIVLESAGVSILKNGFLAVLFTSADGFEALKSNSNLLMGIF